MGCAPQLSRLADKKLKYGLEMTHNGETWINVNTSLTNKIALEALKEKK